MSIRTIWMALSISSGLPKEWNGAIFIYEKAFNEYKVSLRSNDYVDVSKVAAYFGGGGHIHAAGCTMQGHPRDVINNLTGHIEKQMDARREE